MDEEKFFIDGSHIKASANNHKYTDEVIEKSVRYYVMDAGYKISAIMRG